MHVIDVVLDSFSNLFRSHRYSPLEKPYSVFLFMAGLSLRDLSEIERWFRELKNRTKRFYKYINAKTLKSLEELQTAIAAMHNIIRKEEGGNTNLTVPEEGKDKNKCGCNVSKRYQRRS